MPNAAAASRAASPRFAALPGGQPVPGGRSHQMVGVAGQWPLRYEARRLGQPPRKPAQRSRRRRGVHVDAGKVGGTSADDSIEIAGAGRNLLGPARFVPAMSPDGSVGMGTRILGDEVHAVSQRGGVSQIQPG